MNKPAAQPNTPSFQRGDLVVIHHTPTYKEEAIVFGRSVKAYGELINSQYAVYRRKHGVAHGIHARQMELKQSGATERLEEWIAEFDQLVKNFSDLEWVFKNPDQVLQAECSNTELFCHAVVSLAKSMGYTDEQLAGGFNQMALLGAVRPYLRDGDLEGWRQYCQNR